MTLQTVNTKVYQQLNQPASEAIESIWNISGVPEGGIKLFDLLSNGFKYQSLNVVFELGLLSKSEFQKYTDIAPATLDRRRRSGVLNTDESDKVYRLLRLIDAAQQLFSSDFDGAIKWLKTPARGLANRMPIEMIRTSAETESVLDFTGRIMHGVIS